MIQDTIKLELTPTRPIDLTHKQFCRLLVAIINWKRVHLFDKHVAYKTAFGQAERAVEEADSEIQDGDVEAVSFTENRRNKIISTSPPASLRPNEVRFFRRAFDLYFKPGVPEEAWDAIVRSMSHGTFHGAKHEVRRTVQEDPFKHLALLSNVLGLSRISASQERLKFFAGEYLLFRRVRGKRLLAAHFTVMAPPSDDKPAMFLTLGSAGGAVRDSRQVEGVIYEPLEAPGLLFAIGKIKNSSEIRMSVLRAVDKPTRLDNPPADFTDLMGIRLGLGRRNRQPLAYRIYCARLVGDPPQPPWQSYVREYTLEQAHETFSSKVIGFDYIIKWLNNPLFVVLDDEDDPTLE